MTSFDRFNTVAFDRAHMLATIRRHPVRADVVDAVTWFATVPERFRESVYRVIVEVFAHYHGRPLSHELIYDLAVVLHAEIWRRADEIDPTN